MSGASLAHAANGSLQRPSSTRQRWAGLDEITGSPSRAAGNRQVCWVTHPALGWANLPIYHAANAVTDIRNLGPAFRPSADGNSVTLKLALCIRPGAQHEPRNEMTGRTSSAPSVVAQSTLVRKGSTSDPVLSREPHCCTGFDERSARRWLLAGVARGRGALSYPVPLPAASTLLLAASHPRWELMAVAFSHRRPSCILMSQTTAVGRPVSSSYEVLGPSEISPVCRHRGCCRRRRCQCRRLSPPLRRFHP
ncbi:uncharacterized protein LY79DRAFT_557346 [Colletotrichum navitas]|uniref:Uncharacterized protein n=1 Tax=Colletotrichum navitas TaxID=681940 RepID=A0AAD8V4K9_9PEZI|nr:uncharacterized protein LY79DRAFT_557346 [Colletotrichum navitas]KAK1586045.1 hypothetical protein LY79DRAFT_557346 [Colletotrichum navitas]